MTIQKYTLEAVVFGYNLILVWSYNYPSILRDEDSCSNYFERSIVKTV